MHSIWCESNFAVINIAKAALIFFGSVLPFGRGFNGFNNAVITGTAAKVAGYGFNDLTAVGAFGLNDDPRDGLVQILK